MKSEAHHHTFVWLFLLALSVLNFSVSAPGGRLVVAVILATAGAKAIVLAWHFMDLRHAHLFWKATLILMITGLLAAVHGLNQSSRLGGGAAEASRPEKTAASPYRPATTSQNLIPVKALPVPTR